MKRRPQMPQQLPLPHVSLAPALQLSLLVPSSQKRKLMVEFNWIREIVQTKRAPTARCTSSCTGAVRSVRRRERLCCPAAQQKKAPRRLAQPVPLIAILGLLIAFVPRAQPFTLESSTTMASFLGLHRSTSTTSSTSNVAASLQMPSFLILQSTSRSDDGGDADDKMENDIGNGNKKRKGGGKNNEGKKRPRRRFSEGGGGGGTSSRPRRATNSTSAPSSPSRKSGPKPGNKKRGPQQTSKNLIKRVAQLEGIVAGQSVEIRKLREECKDLREAAGAFAQVVELLRQAGLSTENYENNTSVGSSDEEIDNSRHSLSAASSSGNLEDGTNDQPFDMSGISYDDYALEATEIFGSAPSSVIDAADAAGAAILAALLAGKQRMLVDVRDAELSRDPDILVQFIELAVLPVAAGLEGIEGTVRTRVKIVFPTVSQLLQYRKTMALAGTTDVLTLSTLGFDPVQEQDSLVVIIAPSPDDEEGIDVMNELISSPEISQPIVVLNHHMVPVAGLASKFSVAYHLRLLSVQYMTGDMTPEYIEFLEKDKKKRKDNADNSNAEIIDENEEDDASDNETEEALEAAMNRAHELGVTHGVTRAMVIRAYPRPWHIFVDTSPDSDADFEVAATFDKEPSPDDVNYAIVECLEGSETEDEIVAQQMQAALESGQLNKVSEMLDIQPSVEIEDGDGNGSNLVQTNSSKTESGDGGNNGEEDDDIFYDDFTEDTL